MQIIGVPGLSSNAEAMAEFVESTGSGDIPHILDNGGEIWARFGVTQQRTYVYINDGGEARATGYGSLQADVEDLISR